MLGFIGDHFIVIPIGGAAIFMALMIGVTIEERLRNRHERR